ncbi:hypothetical protein OG426_08045 [Streptomyces canus]|uniref:hypothetical protein n=1 Tax=Streptomyces canus TaxID=58343 RepID=UPI00225607EE|nr:hypothetical protein [Streptomyces canus]MCX4852340.1 hypothetical protein [Streptomyces canus]WSW32435.1 hypothetical protein OG426_08045 [Streptomyces canus]
MTDALASLVGRLVTTAPAIVTADGVRAVACRAGLHPVDPAGTERVARLEADVRL